MAQCLADGYMEEVESLFNYSPNARSEPPTTSFLRQLASAWEEVAEDGKFLPPLLSDILVPELLFCFSSPTWLVNYCATTSLRQCIRKTNMNDDDQQQQNSRVLGVVCPNLYMSSPKALSDIILIHLNSPTATQEFRLGSGSAVACFAEVECGWLIKFHSSLL